MFASSIHLNSTDQLIDIYTNLSEIYASSIHLNSIYLAHIIQDIATSCGSNNMLATQTLTSPYWLEPAPLTYRYMCTYKTPP